MPVVMKPKKSSLVIASALACLLVFPANARAGSPYRELVDAFAGRDRLMDGFDRIVVSTLVSEAMRDPDLVEMDSECPGTIDLMAKVSAPVLREAHERAVDEYRRDLEMLFARGLTKEQAQEASEFYRSEDGQFMIGVAETYEVAEASLAEVRETEDGTISRDAFDQDKAATRDALRTSGHRQRLASIGFDLYTSDWFRTFDGLREEILTLELALSNSNLTNEEDAQLESLVEDQLTDHFERCYAE